MHDGLEAGRPSATTLEARLYDAHGARLYVYCWSLVGDDAPEAVKDTFEAVGRLGPPRGDVLLWLHALARTACMRRGALDRVYARTFDPDPLRRAAARLRADHREALILFAGDWLETPDIARLLGVATDTVRQLIQVAGANLERAVLDTLMHEPMTARHDDVIAAFEKGTLPALLAGRAPARPPTVLRDEVLAAAGLPSAALPSRETAPHRRATAATPTAPLVVIGPRATGKPGATAGRRTRRAAEAAGLAAAVAAAAGLLAAWPSSGGSSATGGLTALSPGTDGARISASAGSATPLRPGTAPENRISAPFAQIPGLSPSPRPSSPPDDTGHPLSTTPATGAPPAAGTPHPSRPGGTTRPGTPPTTSTPTTTPTPTDPPTETPADPPTETPEPTPTSSGSSTPGPGERPTRRPAPHWTRR